MVLLPAVAIVAPAAMVKPVALFRISLSEMRILVPETCVEGGGVAGDVGAVHVDHPPPGRRSDGGGKQLLEYRVVDRDGDGRRRELDATRRIHKGGIVHVDSRRAGPGTFRPVLLER